MPAWQRPWSDQGLAPPLRMPETPEEELQALRFSRHAPASFAIARKAVMICGRPTVVLGGHGVCVSCQIVDSHDSDADPHSRAALQVSAHRRTERGEGPHPCRSCRDPRPPAKWRHGLRECGAWAGRLREENRGGRWWASGHMRGASSRQRRRSAVLAHTRGDSGEKVKEKVASPRLARHESRGMAGRKALVLTHELAKGTYDPYLSDMLWPLRPLLCFGRSAAAAPAGEAKHAVMCWWRDRRRKTGGKDR